MIAASPDAERGTGRERALAFLLRPSTPPLAWGTAAGAGLIVVEILLVHLLKMLAPENAFGAVFVFGVLCISAGWGFRTAIAMSVASTAAYAYVHVVESSESLVPSVLVFLVLALLTNLLVGQSRVRAVESDQRRREADLLADFARILLRRTVTPEMFGEAGRRLTDVLELPAPYAVLGAHDVPLGPGHQRITLRDGTTPTGSLLVPAHLSPADSRRVRRVVPSLEALLAASRERERLHRTTVDLARQQASLRRIATLVALRSDLDEVYRRVAEELADGLDVEHVSLVRYENHEHYTVISARDDDGAHLHPGEVLPLGGHNVCTLVHDSGRPTTIDYREATGPIAQRLAERGFATGIGVPITVDDTVWGAVVVGVSSTEDPKHDVYERLSDFADLVATAVYNNETRARLTESRARVVAAADQARRVIERDLHDGAQQRIVSLGMDLRAAQASVPDEFSDLRDQLDRSVRTLSLVHSDLQELSRGIHPAILSRGGLAPALKTLARRSPVPTALTTDIPGRLPESVEVAAYYVVAEALTNTVKYAQATEVVISAVARDGALELTVTDDGSGGADASGGSGLIGLQDRVHAIGGTLTVSSPLGVGTTLEARIPATR